MNCALCRRYIYVKVKVLGDYFCSIYCLNRWNERRREKLANALGGFV